jgi:nitroimidazol reductase NimA-like FMN-containing flavoprotein (pyridoxamine 5'-phosphate oxidase superfamily)
VSGDAPVPRTKLGRLPARGTHDPAAIRAILDEGLVCHVGFVHEGHPYVMPSNYGRLGDALYLHGSRASRMLRALAAGAPACVTVTIVDGVVLARSAFHHSMNYRSAVVLGVARAVEDEAERLRALEAVSEHAVPGRWAEVRPPSAKELAQTAVVALPISAASAKVRRGPPIDDEEDLALPVWAGELPLRLVPGAPVADAGTRAPAPPYLAAWRRR